jgi:hypothetical protein
MNLRIRRGIFFVHAWMPSKEGVPLHYSCEFLEIKDESLMRQTSMAKGDFHISRRAVHPDLNLTKSDVKVRRQNRKDSPAKSA